MATAYKSNTAANLGMYAGSSVVAKLGSDEAANGERVYYREIDRVSVTLEKPIEGLTVARRYDRVEYKALRQHALDGFMYDNALEGIEGMTAELWDKAFDKWSGIGETFTKDENDVFGIRKGKNIVELNAAEIDALNVSNPFRYANVYM
jgi:hypothetical protein